MSKTEHWRWKIAQASEIRWWKGYLKNKPKADYLKWKKAYWNGLLEKCEIKPAQGEKVLDAGCGPAGVFMVLEDQKVDALDPLLEKYAQELAHFSESNYPAVRFISSPLEDFVPEGKYDTVFCLNAINHVADLDLCFDKLVSFVKPGGQLVVSIDAHNYNFFKHLFRLLPGDILHPHQYDLEEYKTMLTERNCKIEKTVLVKKEFFFDYHLMVARVFSPVLKE